MKSAVYIETTIVSYLMARPARDLVFASNQQLTREWWDRRRSDFELFASQAVIDEASSGDPAAAQRRLDVLRDIPLLALTAECVELAKRLVSRLNIPPRAAADALHIAIATVHKVQYLMTWNCTHLANAALRPLIESVCEDAGYVPTVICTPQELMENLSEPD